jgi:uncharacterized protein YegL
LTACPRLAYSEHMKNKTKSNKDANKPTLVAFLLDRTGSMASCKDETIKGFNGYIDSLKDKKAEQIVFTLTQFDSIAVDIIHDAVPLNRVQKLNEETYQPRANTPLYDAIGKTIRATEQSAGDKYKVLFVTLTDGQENASSEWNEKTVKDLIKEKESEDHWTFAHIGVGANGWEAARRISVGTLSSSNVLNIDPKDTGKTYRRMSAMTMSYCADTSNVSRSAQNLWKGSED